VITGQVSQLHALLPVEFRAAGGPAVTIEFVVDTGFTGALALPAAAVAALGLPYALHMPATLADDSETHLPVHEATIVWDGHEAKAAVIAAGRRPLLGTALLDGATFTAQFVEGGLVSVVRI
jgi:clan AA aspartic protease